MWQFINTSGVMPFGVAIMLMLALGAVELLSLLLGASNDWLDGLLPESLTEINADIGIDGSEAGFIGLLSWLYLGKVPMLMWLVVFLTVFGLTGLVMQSLLWQLFGWVLPSLIATPVVFIASLPLVRIFAGVIHKIMPKDETSAITSDSLVGRVGMIVIGQATQAKSAQVKVKDSFGQTHYVMALADNDETLHQGEYVLLVAKEAEDMYFRAIKNKSTVMVD